jgi:DNA polymerase-3 subunit delta'
MQDLSSEFLPWWEDAWRQLWNRRLGETLPHAILVTGSNGLGKSLFATEFAAALLCARPGTHGIACGSCSACRLSASSSHPDLHQVIPPEDKQQILVDQIRALTAKLGMKSHAGGFKIALIHPAECMNVAAANSLLKTLEEPTDNTLLLLVSERPARLFATIRSRCQTCHLQPPPVDRAVAWLGSKLGNQQSVKALLRLAAGAPLHALRLAELDVLEQRKGWIAELKAVLEECEDPVRVAARWSAGAEELSPLYWFGVWLTDMIRCEQAPAAELRDADLHGYLKQLGRCVGPATLHQLLQRVWEALRLPETALNRQLLIEDILIDWGRAKARR